MTRRLSCAVLALAAATVWAPSVFAQDAAVAEVLFAQGRSLMQQGKYAEACPKFDESQRIAPSAGALLNLGECYVKVGKSASAWAAFKGAVGAAQGAGQTEREQYARDRANELEATIARLTVTVPSSADVPGLVIRRDGAELGRAAWGIPVPADAGAHEVIASAPGRRTWKAHVTISAASTLESIFVPALERDGSGSAGSQASPDEGDHPEAASGWPAQRTYALVVGGVGVGGMAIGSLFGLQALSAASDASARCPTLTTCDAQGFSRGKDAHAAATASTVLFLLGGAAAGAGAILWLTAPTATRRTSLGLRVGPGSGAVEGAW